MYNIYQKIALVFFIISLLVLGGGAYLYGKNHNTLAYRKINKVVSQFSFWNQNKTNLEVDNKKLTTNNKEDTYPAERVINFSWKYQGKEYSLDVKILKELYEKYHHQAKVYTYKGELEPDWVEKYYANFFKLEPGDDSIKQLAKKLEILAKDNNLNSDQLVELTMAFVQSIPYDKVREGNIINKVDGEFNNYAYETLYNKKGICFDKTFLAILILRKFGYGTAVLDFPEVNHSAVGIACPKNYSIYGSGYCYAEATNFFPVGVVPQKKDKIVTYNQSLSSFTGQFDNIFNPTSLGRASILNKTTGKLYNGVEKTYFKVEKIKSLERLIDKSRLEIDKQQKQIIKKQTELDGLQKKLKKYEANNDLESYNQLLPEYNSKIKAYNDSLGLTKLKIKILNEKIVQYNKLITEFVLPTSST